MADRSPRVFISYSHDSPEHRDRVLALANRLCNDGVDVAIDRYILGAPQKGWQRWTIDQLEWADLVLVVCTETYYRRFRGQEESEKGYGADFEGFLITAEIYRERSETNKFVSVFFNPRDEAFIPEPLQGTYRCLLDSEDRYLELYRVLTGQPAVVKPPLGQLKKLETLRWDGAAPPPPGEAPIREIPAPAHDFTDRRAQLDVLQNAVRQDKRNIIGLFGMPGIGKTELARRVALQVSDVYPDGQLYLDLKGLSRSPATTHEALSYVVRKVSRTAALPDELDELRKLYLSVLYNARVLIFLDDAVGAEQVADLAPPPSCLLVLTARTEFDLAGMESVTLPLMARPDAVEFLRKVEERIGDFAGRIAELCGYLPFSLRFAAQTIKQRRDLTVSGYVTRLETNAGQRAALGDPVVATSYDLLSPEERKQQWCALACFADPFERAAAAALWELSDDQTDAILGGLFAQSMVLFNESLERYYLHDLARLFATAHLEQPQVYQRRHAVHFLRYARQHRQPLTLLDGVAGDVLSAYEWCEAQRTRWNAASLTAVVRDLLETDAHGAAEVVYLIGRLFKRRGRFQEALPRYEECLRAAQELGIASLTGACLRSLAEIYDAQGDAQRGAQCREQALQTLRAAADPDSQTELIFTLHLCSEHSLTQGDVDAAETWARASLRVRDQIPADRRDPNAGLSNGAIKVIAYLLHRGDLDKACSLLREESANLVGVDLASTLGQVACALGDAGRYREAETLFDAALQAYESTPNYAGSSWIKRRQAELHAQQGHLGPALACYEQALDICRQRRLEPYQTAVALLGLSRLHSISKDLTEARRHLAAYEELRPYVAVAHSDAKVKVAAALTALAQALQALARDEEAASTETEAGALRAAARSSGEEAHAVQLLGERWGCDALSLAWPGRLRLPKSH